mgnify:CR=1 FL=1|tara:strand:+ start:511 stop:1038 length:528 start_codon:yes stop_codon:yes gene_type:complete
MSEQKNPKGGKLLRSWMTEQTEGQIAIQVRLVKESFPDLTDSEIRKQLSVESMAEIYTNSIYQVAVYRGDEADDLVHVPELKGQCTWLSIKRRDKRPVNHWQDMQTMKNRLVGTECDAFQIFPAESRMVNTANQYHLIVLPEGKHLPFGWRTRAVKTQDNQGEGISHQTFKGEVV